MSAPITSVQRFNTRHHPRAAAGFTLLELMVAMTAGAIVISSMYFITSASTNYFREQQRISNVQSSVRYAMDQLRRDITRAGFGSTPNNQVAPYRVNGGGGIQTPITAVALTDLPGLDPSGAGHQVDGQPLAGDILQLTGNYATSSDYPLRPVLMGGTTFKLDTDWTRFTRDFTGWVNGPPYATLTGAGNPFDTAFMPGRLVSVRTNLGARYFSQIVGTNAGTAEVTVATPITAPGLFPSRISPVSVMQYMPVPAAAGLVHNNLPVAGQNMVLVRREVRYGGNAPVANTFDRVLAERVVHFNVDFMVNTLNTANNRTQPAILAPSIGAAAQGFTAAFPERVFSALVTLGVRTAMADPRFRWLPQNPGDELTRFRYDVIGRAAARVRIARAEIFLPNIAYPWTAN